MKSLNLLLCAVLWCAPASRAQDKQVSPGKSTPQAGNATSGQTAAEKTAIDPGKEKDIRRLLELTGTKARMEQSMAEMEKSIRPLMESSLPPGEYRPQLVEAFFTKFHAEMDLQKLINQAVASYDRHFSGQEIKELVRFYESPAGKKTATALPEIMTEMTNTGRQMGQDLGRKCMLEVLAEHPKYEKAMEEARRAAPQP